MGGKKAACKISVIVPVYNKEEYLRQCIDSILGQSYQKIELILVDDGSVDNSGAICDEYAKKEERVQALHRQNGGPTAACVAGMAAASGEYYMFVDSDDYLDAQMLWEMSKQLKGTQGEVVICNHVLEKRRDTVFVSSAIPAGVYEGERLEKEFKERLLGNEKRLVPMSRCMKLCEKSIFDGNEKYYDISIRLGDDFHLMYPALLNSRRVVVMEEAFFYHYRYVEGSIVHRYDEKMIDSVNAWRESVAKVAADKKVHDGEKKLDREYCYMLMYVMKNELRNPNKNYIARIQQIFYDKDVRMKVINTPLSVTERANQFLYLAMQYPEKMLLRILRFIMGRYDKKGR